MKRAWGALCCVLIMTWAGSASADLRYEVRPFITAQQQYTSNLDLAPSSSAKEDWITTFYPGLSLKADDAQMSLDFTGRAGFNFYAHNSDRNYVSGEGNLNFRYNPTRQLSFRLGEYSLYSEDPRSGGFVYMPVQLGTFTWTDQNKQTHTDPLYAYDLTRTQRVKYWRNVLSPSLDWNFDRNSNTGILYRLNTLRNQTSTLNTAYQDSTESYISPYVTYWLNQNNAITLDYGYTKGDFQTSPDLTGHAAHGRYTYRYDAQMSMYLDYTFLLRDFETGGTDYTLNQPLLGMTYGFARNMTGTAQVGYFWQNPSGTQGKDGFSGLLRFVMTEPATTTYTVSLESGYREDFFSSQSLGFSQYKRALASVTHRLTQRMRMGFVGVFERDDYSTNSRSDDRYSFDLTGDYDILRWLNLGGRVGYLRDDSNLPGQSYDEYHVFITLTAFYEMRGL